MSVTIARSTVILSFFPFQQFNHFKLLLQVQLKILLSSYTSGFKSLEEKKMIQHIPSGRCLSDT